MDIFSKNLDLGKQAHLFWDFNVRDVSACVLVPRRPSVLMLMFDVLQQIQFIEKKRSTPGQKRAKSGSVSADSSQSQARAGRFTKHLPLLKAYTTRVRTTTNSKKLFRTSDTHRKSSS